MIRGAFLVFLSLQTLFAVETSSSKRPRIAVEKLPTERYSHVCIKDEIVVKESSSLYELDILLGLNHKNIISVQQFHRGKCSFSMKRYKSDLFHFLESGREFSQVQLKIFVRELLEALSYLHGRSVFHRDLSTENILVTEDLKPIIIDFEDVSRERLSKIISIKPSYLPPECYRSRTLDLEKTDMWSAGVVIFMLVFKSPVFDSANIGDRNFMYFKEYGLKKYIDDVYPDIACDSKTVDFLSKILEVDPEKRLGACELLDHPWLQL